MKLRITKTRARDTWLGLFYIGRILGPEPRYGVSISFGKLTYLVTWK